MGTEYCTEDPCFVQEDMFLGGRGGVELSPIMTVERSRMDHNSRLVVCAQ